MSKAFIYILKDPRDKSIKYVGKTVAPKRRLGGHIGSGKYQRTVVEKWIYELSTQGQVPIMEVIKEYDEKEIDNFEKFWIDEFSKSNILLNSRDHAGAGKIPRHSGTIGHVIIGFRSEDTNLYQWFLSLIWRWSDKSRLGREAIECYRLFNGSLAQAQEAARALAKMRRLFGDDWEVGVKQFEEAVKKV